MFKTNEYFEGKVKSIAFTSVNGPATIGVMAAGEYTFSTAVTERMTVVTGSMKVTLPDADEPTTYKPGDSFDVPGATSFDVSVESDTSYLCLYGV